MISATVSASQPILECPVANTTPITVLDPDISFFLSRPLDDKMGLAVFRSEIKGLIGLIARLNTLYSEEYDTLTSESTSMIAFIQLCSAVEHRLLSVKLPRYENSTVRDPDVLIYDISRLALLMCMNFLFRKMSPQAVIFSSLQKRLRNNIMSLESIDESIADEGSLRSLLWAICIGGLTSADHPWFAIRIHRCMSSLKLQNWDELRLCLLDHVWVPRLCDQRLLVIWRVVQTA